MSQSDFSDKVKGQTKRGREMIKTQVNDGTHPQNLKASNYMFKVNNRNTKTRCKICSNLTITTPERRQWRRSDVFIGNFEHISHLDLVLVFLLLTLS